MRIAILFGIVLCYVATARAEFVTYSGMLSFMKNGKIVLIDRGSERSLEYSKKAICYVDGREVSCDLVRVHSKVRVDCPTNKACVRIIVDQAPR